MLAAKVFARTAAYDAAIASYLSSIPADADLHVAPERAAFPRALQQPYEQVYSLRYGENPHQKAAFYRERDAVAGSIAFAAPVTPSAKELSFNNLVDLDAALEAVKEFETPAAVVVKHTNPCGVARAATLEAAYRAAREADPVSAFGGIVALNREVDEATAKAPRPSWSASSLRASPRARPSCSRRRRTSASSRAERGRRARRR
jgi:phosphoribosylaminoimidazolecarboxamide formyltransferase/IMP cyclohydrolase